MLLHGQHAGGRIAAEQLFKLEIGEDKFEFDLDGGFQRHLAHRVISAELQNGKDNTQQSDGGHRDGNEYTPRRRRLL